MPRSLTYTFTGATTRQTPGLRYGCGKLRVANQTQDSTTPQNAVYRHRMPIDGLQRYRWYGKAQNKDALVFGRLIRFTLRAKESPADVGGALFCCEPWSVFRVFQSAQYAQRQDDGDHDSIQGDHCQFRVCHFPSPSAAFMMALNPELISFPSLSR